MFVASTGVIPRIFRKLCNISSSVSQKMPIFCTYVDTLLSIMHIKFHWNRRMRFWVIVNKLCGVRLYRDGVKPRIVWGEIPQFGISPPTIGPGWNLSRCMMSPHQCSLWVSSSRTAGIAWITTTSPTLEFRSATTMTPVPTLEFRQNRSAQFQYRIGLSYWSEEMEKEPPLNDEK